MCGALIGSGAGLLVALVSDFTAGTATSGISYLSEVFGGQNGDRRSRTLRGSLGLVPLGRTNDPRRGCTARNPFGGMTQGGSDYGYRYQMFCRERTVRKAPERFRFAEFGREVVTGFVMGGLASAAFYGAGRAVEAVKSSVRSADRGSEELIHVYRGTDRYSEIDTFIETGHLTSDATGDLYRELGNLNDAYVQSNSIHDSWLKIWGNENDYVQAHGAFGMELSKAFGLKRTFISVTTDANIAQSFAGANGRVFEAYIPKSQLVEQTLSGAWESEYLIRFDSGGFK